MPRNPEVINLTKNFIFIDLTKEHTNTQKTKKSNTNILKELLKKVKNPYILTGKAKKMYTLAKRTNTPTKERLQAARMLLKFLKIT